MTETASAVIAGLEPATFWERFACAGSTATWVRIDQPREATSEGHVTFTVTVGGGLGGHSA